MKRLGSRSIALFSLVSAVLSSWVVSEAADPAFSRLFFGVQPPTSRVAERTLEVTLELLDAERYGEAAPLIDRLFAREADRFNSAGESVKRRLLDAIGARPPAAANAVRSVLSGEYERAIDGATTTEELRTVVARYPAELFGVAALEALAKAEADAGAYRQAAQLAARARGVAEARGDAASADRLSWIEAANRLRVGQDGAARRLVGRASQRSANAVRREIDEIADATAATADQTARQGFPASWLSSFKQGVAPGPRPGGWLAWRAAAPSSAARSRNGEAAEPLPVTEAVAIDGRVVVATAGGLVAYDAATGKRLWRVRFPPESRRVALDGYEAPFRGRGLSRVRGGLSSDGACVFAVGPPSQESVAAGVDREDRFGRFGRRVIEGAAPPVNRLAAYELETAGKLRWRIDGSDAAGPLPGASFLGAPAVAGSCVYALAEIDQTIVLLQVDRLSGRLLWRQPLLRCERGADERALSIGARPTVGERLVYCPTGRGAVVAVDPVRRSLVWIHDIEVDEKRAKALRRQGWGVFGAPESSGDGEGAGAWTHCRAVADGERLLVVSPESPDLLALEAASGEILWKRELPDGLLLGPLIDGAAVVVHRGEVSAWEASTGESAWRIDLPVGAAPAGAGLALRDGYALPLDSGALALVRPRGDEVSLEVHSMDRNPLDARPVLGNLLYHEGAVVAVSRRGVEAYRQPSSDESPIADSSVAAIDRFERLVAESPEDRDAKERLAVALIQHGQPQAIGERLPDLVAGSLAKAHAALARLQSAIGRRDYPAAFAEALAIDRTAIGEVVVRPSSGLACRASRLARGRLRSALRAAEGGQMTAPRGLADGDDPEARAFASAVGLIDLPPSGTPSSNPTPAADWSGRQVRVESVVDESASESGDGVTRRTRPDRSRQPYRLASGQPGQATAELAFWAVEPRESASPYLIGVSPEGEKRFAVPAPDLTLERRRKRQEAGAPGDRAWRDWLVAATDVGYRVARFPSSGRATAEDDSVSWSSEEAALGDWDRRAEPPAYGERPVAAGPWGVVALQGDAVTCRELATGRLLWRRDFAAAPQRLLADDGKLYLLDDSGGGAIVSAWSGEMEADAWSAPDPKGWRAAVGGRLLTEERVGTERRLRIVSLAEPDSAPHWAADTPASTLATVVEGRWLALLDGERRLTLVDLAVADEVFSVRLPIRGDLPVRALRLREQAGRLLVEVDRANPMIDRTSRLSPLGRNPLLTGELHCLDPATGRSLWAGPAEVVGMAVVAPSVPDAPLVFLARKREGQADDDGAAQPAAITMVTLDLGTGATVHRQDDLPADAEANGWPLWVQRESIAGRDRLLVRVGQAWLTFAGADEPAPPRPPMVARVEDPEVNRPPTFNDLLEGFFGR